MFKFKIIKTENDMSDKKILLSTHFQQTLFWIKFKSLHGWQYFTFLVEPRFNNKTMKKNETIVLVQDFKLHVLVRTFKHLFSIAYIPMGPDCSEGLDRNTYLKLCADLADNLKDYLPQNTICIRIDPPLDFANVNDKTLFIADLKTFTHKEHLNIYKSKNDIQPPDSTILDLSKSTDILLSEMKAKWRYNIRLAQKKNVIVKEYNADSPDFEQALNNFYSLFETTSKRDGIAIHTKEYLKSLFVLNTEKNFKSKYKVSLYIASNEDDYLSGIITLFTKTEAVYLYGASSNIKRNLMSTYMLQWQAINDAKAFGSKIYDFYGMPPTDDPHHPMHGLYRFKTGFGGSIIHRLGSIDIPLNFLYHFYTSAEDLRAFYHKKIKKMIAGR